MITFLIALALQLATPSKTTVKSTSTMSVCDNGGWVDKDVKK
ncbi:hypothetical protein [Rhodocytophaga rosea]|nr:hypothetical protein [Rhodocytophaga rosea]